jgi:hypothetical protein
VITRSGPEGQGAPCPRGCEWLAPARAFWAFLVGFDPAAPDPVWERGLASNPGMDDGEPQVRSVSRGRGPVSQGSPNAANRGLFTSGAEPAD